MMKQDIFQILKRKINRSTNIFTAIYLIIGLVLVYIFNNVLNSQGANPNFQIYVFKPITWLLLGGLFILYYRQGLIPGKITREGWLMTIAAIFGIIQVGILIIFGLIFGFGYSPYARTWYLVLLNIWHVGVQLICLEIIRWGLLKLLDVKYTHFSTVFPWLICVFVLISPGRYSLLDSLPGTFEFIGNIFLPLLAKGLLATYLAMVGGPFVSFSYLAVLSGFEWLSPILPDLPLMVTAFLNSVLPMVGLLVVNKYFLTPKRKEISIEGIEERSTVDQEKNIKESASSLNNWVIILIFGISMLFFNTGVFGIRPMLISGFSMEPTFVSGDIVITHQVAPEDLEVRDIIWFVKDGVGILHRIEKIERESNTTYYITKGDNNNVLDSPLIFDQIRGKVIFIFPKIGWPAIWVSKAFNWLGSVLS